MPEQEPLPVKTSFSKNTWIAGGIILLLGILLQQYFKHASGFGNSLVSSNAIGSVEKISVNGDTNGWKDYTNEKLGFSVKYPANATLRGQVDSDLAIVMLNSNETQGKQAMVTLTKKKVPLNQAAYASLEDFWKDEQKNIVANNGVASSPRSVEINGQMYMEAGEDNRQINYMGLHRYSKIAGDVYEVTLTIEGDRLLDSSVNGYNQILSTFHVK